MVALCATTFLLWIGGSSILPLLPSYLRQHGSTLGLIGLVMASSFTASVVTQFPAGRLSDRIGRRHCRVVDRVIPLVQAASYALSPAALSRGCGGTSRAGRQQ
jgi:MFS family permease